MSIIENMNSCLSDKEILKLLEEGELFISNFEEKHLGPNSYDLKLAGKVRVYEPREKVLDITKDVPDTRIETLPYDVKPGETIIVVTKEEVGCMTRTFGLIFPRSNSFLLPLVTSCAGLLDTGFRGILKGSITNVGRFPIRMHENYRVFQILFFKAGKIKTSYDKRKLSKFNNQIEIPTFKIDKEWR